MSKRLLAVDPGREKCGLALLEDGRIIWQKMVKTDLWLSLVEQCLSDDLLVVIGDRTGSEQFVDELLERFPQLTDRVRRVDEHLSSEEARRRYWQVHPPRGWRRLVPVSLQVPPEPVDDFVAVILAERYLQEKCGSKGI